MIGDKTPIFQSEKKLYLEWEIKSSGVWKLFWLISIYLFLLICVSLSYLFSLAVLLFFPCRKWVKERWQEWKKERFFWNLRLQQAEKWTRAVDFWNNMRELVRSDLDCWTPYPTWRCGSLLYMDIWTSCQTWWLGQLDNLPFMDSWSTWQKWDFRQWTAYQTVGLSTRHGQLDFLPDMDSWTFYQTWTVGLSTRHGQLVFLPACTVGLSTSMYCWTFYQMLGLDSWTPTRKGEFWPIQTWTVGLPTRHGQLDTTNFSSKHDFNMDEHLLDLSMNF